MNQVPEEINLQNDEACSEMNNILESAMVEILGIDVFHRLITANAIQEKGASSKLTSQEHPVVDIHRLQSSLEDMFGTHPGRGLAVQIGRASFKYLLRIKGSSLGYSSRSFRLLPLQRKIDQGCESLAAFLNAATRFKIKLEKNEKKYSWLILHDELHSNGVSRWFICMFVMGLLQEALYWMSAGRSFRMVNKCCHEREIQECTIEVDCTPIE